jgi:dTDP-4-amino-4,6-dideoxygalactose transaminase
VSRIYLSPPHLAGDELKVLGNALASNWVAPVGPHLDAFERELAAIAAVPNALALSSATAGLHLALLLLGIGPGDEVACADLTFVASANAIRYVGAMPVFIDADPKTWTLDPGLLEQALAERSRIRAVIAVDLYGQCCDYEAISAACFAREVSVVQDAAEALGSSYRGAPAGGQGDLAVFSFNGNKIITCSGGGALLSRNTAWIDRARKLATQAREPVPHYEHTELGFNYRLSNLLAAVGRVQLTTLTDRVQARRRLNARYRELLAGVPGISFMYEAPYAKSNNWLTCITIDQEEFGVDREAVRLALETADVEARPLWKPMHLQKLYAESPVYGGSVSASLFEHGLCLPSGSALSDEDQRMITDTILAAACGGDARP